MRRVVESSLSLVYVTLMSVKISASYLGNKKTRLIHGPSGAELLTAAPVDNAGDGSSFSPTDLVAAAFGSCVITTLAIFAEREGIVLSEMSIDVEKIMQQAPRRVGELRAKLRLKRPATDDQRIKLERVAHTCPVHKSLHPELTVTIEMDWHD